MVLSKKVTTLLTGFCLCMSMAEVALAQRGGGGRGGVGRTQMQRSRYELATLPEVQAELKLSDDVKKLAADLLSQRRERLGRGVGGGGSDRSAMQAELAKINSEFDAQIVAKLDEAQKIRMNGLLAQVNGGTALLDKSIATALQLREDQVEKLTSVNSTNQTARREALQGKSQEEIQELLPKIAEKDNASLLAVLTEDQKKKFEELKGTALKIDLAPLRAGRGGNRNQ